MLGKPKYVRGDIVQFQIIINKILTTKTGQVAIIDAYGTFFDTTDVSYDIYIPEEQTLYKHISEGSINDKIGHTEEIIDL